MKKTVIIIPIVVVGIAVGVCVGAFKGKDTAVKERDDVIKAEARITASPSLDLTARLEDAGDREAYSIYLEEYNAGEKEAEPDEEPSSEDEAQAGDLSSEQVDISYESQSGALPGQGVIPIAFNPQWQYGDKSRIHTGSAVLYKVSDTAKTVAVNAGHGTIGGSSVKTLCHPDGTPKVTGGSTASGSVSAIAVSGGTTMNDGTPEAVVTLKLAKKVKDLLLSKGYNVLMLRDGDDVQLDNVARTVMANNNAQAHISLHYDSTQNNKGFFYIGVPDVASYRAMQPVASQYANHQRLGESILAGMRTSGAKIYSSGSMALDLTQTSYSTIPSVDLEVGDRGSDYSDASLNVLAQGIAAGLDSFFGVVG